MPRAILAIRRYPLTLLLAGVLFLCSLLLAGASIGKITGGGGDDEGSGLGGTGKTGEFGGGSGSGGAGSPDPFVGQEDNSRPEEQQRENGSPVLQVPEQLVRDYDMPAPVEPARGLGLPPVEPALQENRSLRDITDNLPDTEFSLELPEPRLEESMEPGIEPYDMGDLARFRENSDAESSPTTPDQDNSGEETTESAVNIAADEAEESAQDQTTEEEQRVTPERLQRPELPPFQRVQPVRRAAITPPRVRPMQI